jgi:hypothetical protein
MSAMSFAMTMAGMHFIVRLEVSGILEPPTKNISEGAALMIKKVIEANCGALVGLIQPQHIFSTDDTTQYVFNGADKNGGSTWVLCNPDDLEKLGTCGLYENPDMKNMNGFCIKHTFTFSATGQLAPFYTTVSGLIEKEMPVETCPSSMHVIEIPGLAVGSDVDPSNTLPGYVVFLWETGNNTLDQQHHQHYQENVFLPFVEQVHHIWDGHETGMAVPTNLMASSWCDGDLPQMGGCCDQSSTN